MRQIYLILLFAAMLCFSGCGKTEKPKLVMVTNAVFPPYEYVVDQQIDGIDPHIVRTIAGKLGYELQIQDMSFDSVIAAVQSGKADIAASGLTVTEERKRLIDFTIPYVIAEQIVIVRQDSQIKTVRDLKNKRIGVQHGTTGDIYVARNIKEPERFSSGHIAVAALLKNKIDAVVIDDEPARVFIKQRPQLKRLKEPLTAEEYAFAISKKNKKLLKRFNEELEKMKSSGELAAVISHYKELNTKTAVVSAGTGFLDRFKESVRINFFTGRRYLYLLNGFLVTVKISFFAVLLGIVIGFATAVVRSTADQTGKLRIADFFCRLYLTVIRGTPVVVQLLIIYFVIFGSVNVDKVLVAIIAFGINSGAYVAEIIRGGIMSIDKGQMEAARSLGMGYGQSMREIIFPQAFKTALPSLGNEFIVLLKETSVSGYIALHDLTKGGDIIRSQTYDAFLPLFAVAAIYLAVVIVLEKLLECLEKRLKRNE